MYIILCYANYFMLSRLFYVMEMILCLQIILYYTNYVLQIILCYENYFASGINSIRGENLKSVSVTKIEETPSSENQCPKHYQSVQHQGNSNESEFEWHPGLARVTLATLHSYALR